MINTYNESDLHLTLKKMYALEFNGKTEVRLEGADWICDIIDENGNAIEIQTSNLSALTEKAEFILKSGKKLKIVHPILAEKYIEMLDSSGSTLYRKKSPKKASIYDSLRGMTKICTLFLNEKCTLEVLFVRATEFRRRTANEVQTMNKSRRHLKNWVPAGKRLEEILEKKIFSTKKDFTDLLCGAENYVSAKNIGDEAESKSALFRVCDIARAIKAKSGTKSGAKDARWASLLAWILLKMNLIEVKATKGRSKYYGICDDE